MLVPPAHVTNKNVGLSPKNVGDFLKNVGLFPKNVGVFFENVGDFFAAQRDCFFSLQMRTLAVKRAQWFTAGFSHFTASFILTNQGAPLFQY